MKFTYSLTEIIYFMQNFYNKPKENLKEERIESYFKLKDIRQNSSIIQRFQMRK